MSSLFTKLITSYVGASIVTSELDKMYPTIDYKFKLAFSGIYIAMTFFDLYRIINGTTKNIITKDSEGHFICTKYNVRYFDNTKNAVGFISGLTSAVIGGCIGNDPAEYYLIGAVAGETIKFCTYNYCS